jgi:hypothetical protein
VTAILDLIGWPVALFCSAMAAWTVFRMVTPPQENPRGIKAGKRQWWRSLGADSWFALLLWGAAAIIAFTVLGVIGPLAGALLGGGAVAVLAVWGKVWTGEGRGALRGHLASGPGEAGRSLLGRLRGLLGSEDEPAGGPVPLEAVAGHAATRAVPSVMADPVLGPPTEPGEIAAAGIPVPPPYAALAQFIGGFEPEDDQALRMFMEGHASGTVALADAWHAFAETCLNGVGLSPAYVAGILEAGDSAGEHASLLAQVHKRFHVVYAAVKEWIAAHGPLPHKAREFLTGED